VISDLTDILQLQAHLMARPEGAYRDRNGQPCRHPGGLYSQSLGKVLSCMRKLTDTIQPDVQPDVRSKEGRPATMSALEALFLAIDSHADDLKTILVSTTTLSSKKLARTCHLIDEIVEELAGRPINRVKHHGEKLEACFCFNQQFAVYGYFIAGVRKDGVIAPSEHAHGSSGKQWSVAVTLRRLLGQLVQVARVIQPHVRSTLALPLPTWADPHRSDLRSIAAWLQRCAPYCFPNEVNVLVPDVGLRGDEPYLRFDTLKRLRNALTQGVTWSRSFTADGVSRQFAVD
jgi:hypothetical protein